MSYWSDLDALDRIALVLTIVAVILLISVVVGLIAFRSDGKVDVFFGTGWTMALEGLVGYAALLLLVASIYPYLRYKVNTDRAVSDAMTRTQRAQELARRGATQEQIEKDMERVYGESV